MNSFTSAFPAYIYIYIYIYVNIRVHIYIYTLGMWTDQDAKVIRRHEHIATQKGSGKCAKPVTRMIDR